MKITLNKIEKKQIVENNSITIERACYFSAPKRSIIHGKGIGGIFDKVDYRWVYGDTADYIQKMVKVLLNYHMAIRIMRLENY